MSTWKSKEINTKVDGYDDWVDVNIHWEYQTTADVFSYIEIVNQPSFGFTARKVGEEFRTVRLSEDSAKILYHALSNWIKVYHSEKEQLEAINNNLFEGKEE